MKAVKAGMFFSYVDIDVWHRTGCLFGIAEDSVQSYIAEGVAAHPDVHDDESTRKIWRYAQRAHFHATGIAAFSIGLLLLILHSSLGRSLKTLSSILVGLGGLYPLSWFTMFVLAPSMGRSAAHDHIVTEMFAYLGVGGLLLGLAIVSANLFLGAFRAT